MFFYIVVFAEKVRERERQTDRQTGRQTDRQTERDIQREKCINIMHKITYSLF
jgi:hypothetical protein